MTEHEQECCTRCGAALRRRGGLRSGAWCDPCHRTGPDPRRDRAQVAQVATRLGIPAILLGFGTPGTTVVDAGGAGRKLVSWVERRDFVQHIAGLALGITGMTALDIDRLTALLPQADPTGTRHIGLGDVEVIEQTTATFVRQDYATGAGPIRDLAIAQLRSILPLLNAQVAAEVRPRLYLATARLAMQAGWMSFECNQHDDARRLWTIGLGVARAADHPQASDLTVFLLSDMALQAVHLGLPKEALSLIHLGHAATTGVHPVSPSTTCMLVNAQALAHAAQGERPACDRALGLATEHFNSIDPATSPAWGHLDETRLASLQGDALYELALPSRDPRAAGQAVPLLHQAVDHFGPDYARLQASSLAKLTGVLALSGDLDTAVTVGHQAIDAVTAVSSPRAHDRLRVLNTVLEPLHTSPGVAELRDRLTATAV
ncbi:MAG: hypothetical protein ACRDRX_25370 [Pseudonocardiaceae bacterium]